MELHFISSGRQTKQQLIDTLIQVHSYADYIHLREKNWPAVDLIDVIGALHRAGIALQKLVVNDRVDVAQVAKTGGVQLGFHSIPVNEVKQHFPELRVGCSVHSLDEALQKEAAGADYLLFGHVFPTNSKPGLEPKGLNALEDIATHTSLPVIAIGGITPANIDQVATSGADGAALLSGVLLADHPIESASLYQQSIKGGK